MPKIGNNIDNVSSTFEQDVNLLQNKEDKGFFEGAWDGITETASAISGAISNTYDLYSNDNIKDVSSYKELNNIVDERVRLQENIYNNNTLDSNSKQFELDNINKQYAYKESSLLDRAIDGDNKRELFDTIRATEDDGASLTVVNSQDNMNNRISKESYNIIDGLTKQYVNGFIDDDTLKIFTEIKSVQAKELANLEIKKREAIADLRDSGAKESYIKNTIADYNEFINLQIDLTKEAIKSANEGAKTGDEILDYAYEKMGKKADRLIELKNQMGIDLQRRQAKANLKDGNFIVGTSEMIGFGGDLVMKYTKKLLGAGKDKKQDFKGDLTSINIAEMDGFKYGINYIFDNYDDIGAALVGSITSGAGTKAIANGGAGLVSKYTRLDKLLKNTATGRKILDSRITKFAGRMSDEVTMGLGMNQVINTSLNDINSEDRMLLDAALDLTFGGAIEAILGSGKQGMRFLGEKTGVSKVLDEMFLTDNKVINQLTTDGLTRKEATDLYNTAKDYLKATHNETTGNKNVLDFIKNNTNRLSEEGTILGNGMVLSMKKYSNKVYNPLNVDVAKHIPIIENGGVIDLSSQTIEAIDIRDSIFKVQNLKVGKTNQETVKNALTKMKNLNRKDIDVFIKSNPLLIETLADEIRLVKGEVDGININGIIDEKHNPLSSIDNLSLVFDELAKKFQKEEEFISVFIPDKTKDGGFSNMLVKRNDLSIDGYDIIYKDGQKNNKVFLNKTLKSQITSGSLDISRETNLLIAGGFIDKSIVQDIKGLEDDLSDIFGFNIELNKKGPITLTDEDGLYRIRFSKTDDIIAGNINAKVKIDGTEVVIDNNIVDKMLLDKLLNRLEVFNNGELEESITQNVLGIKKAIVDGLNIDTKYIGVATDDAVTIAKNNVDGLLDGMFSIIEKRQFNTLMDDTILNKNALDKMATLSGLGVKEVAQSIGSLTETLLLQSAKRFSNKNIKKAIAEILTDSTQKLSKINKNEAIINLLLGGDMVSIAKNIGVPTYNKISKITQKSLGLNIEKGILSTPQTTVKDFIDSVVGMKEGVPGWTTKKIKALRESMVEKMDTKTKLARDIYFDIILKDSFNKDGIDGILSSITEVKGKNIYNTLSLEEILKAGDDIKITIQKFNDEMNLIPRELDRGTLTKIKSLRDSLMERRRIEMGDDTKDLSDVMVLLNRVTDSIQNIGDKNMDGIGKQYTYDSQINGGDNIISKSFNHLLNPYNESKVKDVTVSKKIDEFVTKNILSRFNYNGKSISDLNNDIAIFGGDVIEYQKQMDIIQSHIREFLYPQGTDGSFKIDTATKKLLKERDDILNNLVDEVADYIGGNNKIPMLNKNNKLASKAEKINILKEGLGKKNSIANTIKNTLQTRLSKKYFSGFKMNFNKGKKSGLIEGIEDYRTFYKHFNNLEGDVQPIILEGNSKVNGSGFINREQFRIANNLKQYLDTNKIRLDIKAKGSIEKHINKVITDEEELKQFVKSFKVFITKEDRHVPGFINMMNVGDKDSFGAFTKSYIKNTNNGKGKINNFKDFLTINDNRFTKDIVEELNMVNVIDKDTGKWDLVKISKRIATLSSEDEALLPLSNIPIRNYILEEPTFLEAYLQTNNIDREYSSIIDKDGNIIDEKFILDNFKKAINGYKQGFEAPDFVEFGKGIVDILSTPYSDGVSFLHRDQITFYSNYQSHISGRNPIKMHHYNQDSEWNVLFKTNFNSYTDMMEDELKLIHKNLGGDIDFSNTRLVGAESTKLKNYKDKAFVELEEPQFITINGTRHKIKGYVDTDTSFDKHASSESAVHKDANGITKQADVRTHPAASEWIKRMKLKIIEDTVDNIKLKFNVKGKLDAVVFNEFEDLSNYVLNNLELPGSTLGTVNQFLKDQEQTLKGLIETPKDLGLGYRGIMQPRINIIVDGKPKLLDEDEVAVSAERFALMKDKLLKVGDDYYISTYRNPVPNTENMTINKVVIDESMVSEEDVAINSWNVFANKQADFDGDHLNLVYINNKQYLEGGNGKSKNLGGLGITLGTILNIEEAKTVLNKDRIAINNELMKKIYNTDDAIGLQEEITEFISDWIKEQGTNGIPQQRIVVAQVDNIAKEGDDIIDKIKIINTKMEDIKSKLKSRGKKKISKEDKEEILKAAAKLDKSKQKLIKQLPQNTITKSSNNAITGKDNISIVDSFIRTLDLVRKYGWEIENANMLGKDVKVIQDEVYGVLSRPIEIERKLLDNLKQGTKEYEDKLNTIKGLEETLDVIINNLGNASKSVTYKSEAGSLEQVTLDLAKAGLDKLWDGWEENLLHTVFPGIDSTIARKILDPIGFDTGKVYKGLGESGILKYGKHYDVTLGTYIDSEINTLGQHTDLHEKIRREFSTVYKDLVSISTVTADKKFYGYMGHDYYKEASTLLKKYNIEEGVIKMFKGESTYVSKPGEFLGELFAEGNIPGIKISFTDKKFHAEIINPTLIPNGIPGIKNGKITSIQDITNYINDRPFPGIKRKGYTGKGGGTVNTYEVTDVALLNKTFNERYAGIPLQSSFGKNFDNKLLVELLLDKNLSTFVKGKKPVLDGWETIPAGKGYIIQVDPALKKSDVVNDALDLLKVADEDRNAIRLYKNLNLDTDYLTSSERVKLMLSHYAMKDADLKDITKDITIFNERVKDNLLETIKDINTTNLTDEQTKVIKEVQETLGEQIEGVKDISGNIVIRTEDTIVSHTTINGKGYNINFIGDKDNYQLYELVAENSGDIIYKSVDEDVKPILKDLTVTNPERKEYDIIKKVGVTIDDLKFISEASDKAIDDVGKYAHGLISARTSKIFKDLMLRNTELKNNASFDLYEDFNHIQSQFDSTVNKGRRRELDNIVFMDLYTGKGNMDEAELTTIKNFKGADLQYYAKVREFVLGPEGSTKQSIQDLFVDLNINLSKTLSKAKGAKGLKKLFSSSLVEDLVNLHHKTEKIAFYEEGIYNWDTFKEAFKIRSDKIKVPYNEKEAKMIYDVIFEYDVIKNESAKKIVNGLRGTTFSTTLGMMSWFTGMAGAAMGIMQIPSELMRIGTMTKHLFNEKELDNLLNDYKILKSTGIEASLHFGPIEPNQQWTNKIAYNILSLGTPRTGTWDKIAKIVSALFSNPLLITDLVVDGARKRTAIGNQIHLLGFDSIEGFKSHLDTLSPGMKTDLLNKVRMGSEFKYHNLSGGVTAGSYLSRETVWNRMTIKGIPAMLPFNYLMNWALNIQSSAFASARQTWDGFRNITRGDIDEGLRLLREDNIFTKIVMQSVAVSGLYAKLNSHDRYDDSEFDKQKSVMEFVRTLNANLLAVEMFFPNKSIIRGIEQEGGIIAKVDAGARAFVGSTFRELDLVGIAAEELAISAKIPGYNVVDAILTSLVEKGSKGLAYSKAIVNESQFADFSKRSMIDTMFGVDNPNFDESLYNKIYSESKGETIEALWDNGHAGILLWEIMKSTPILRHLSNLSGSGTSYSFYDKQVRAITEKMTSGTYDHLYNNTNELLYDIYTQGDIDKVYKYVSGFAVFTGQLNRDNRDKTLIKTDISEYIPEIEYSNRQLIESIMDGELIAKYGTQGYINEVTKGNDTEHDRYVKQLLMKINTESPAKLPYVLGQLVSTGMWEYEKAFKKLYGHKPEGEELNKAQGIVLEKYSDLIKANKPLVAQMMGYKILNDHSELKTIALSNKGFLKETIADRITSRILMSDSFNKGSNHASYIGSRMGTITNGLKRKFTNGDITEGQFKTSMLNIYRLAADEVHNGNFTQDQALEIKTTLYKSLGENAYIIYEDPKLGKAYEDGRINLAHKLYEHTNTLEQYAHDAQLSTGHWSINNPSISKGFGTRFKSAYRNTNLIRKYNGGGGSRGSGKGGYGTGYTQGGYNNIQRMLGHPKTNFKKVFNPSYKAFNNTSSSDRGAFGFRFTPDDRKIFINYYRFILSNQYSKDFFDKKGTYNSKGKVFKTFRRKAELTKQDYKNVGSKNFRGFMSRGLLRGLPGSKEG